MAESHRGMRQIDDEFTKRVEDVVESLVAIGDLIMASLSISGAMPCPSSTTASRKGFLCETLSS